MSITLLFNSLLIQDGMLDRDGFQKFLRTLFYTKNNVFEYLSQDEMAMLYARWPDNYMKSSDSREHTTMWILDHVSNKRPDCDWKVFAIFVKQSRKEYPKIVNEYTYLYSFIQVIG